MDETGYMLQFHFMEGCCFYIQHWYNKVHMKHISASSAKLLYKTLYVLLRVFSYKKNKILGFRTRGYFFLWI